MHAYKSSKIVSKKKNKSFIHVTLIPYAVSAFYSLVKVK